MKSLVVIAVLSFSAVAFAAKPYGMAGCGLGSMVMGKQGNQVLAATTNGTGTQTFGISSGSSNCVTATEQTAMIKNFIETNQEALVTDMAKGQGDSLKTLSSMYGCNSDAFSTEMKNHYSEMAAVRNDSTKMMININNIIEDNSALNTKCTHGI